MSTQQLQTYQASNQEKKVVISNQEVTTRNWKFNSIFKLITGIIYGFFFGMLPASFVFNTSITEPTVLPAVEISSIVLLMVIGIVSIGIILWQFRGDIKKKHPLMYYLIHSFNGLLLSVGILFNTIQYPSIQENRYLVFAISYGAWAVIMVLTLVITLSIYKKQYPLSNSRVIYSSLSLLFAGASMIFPYFAQKAIGNNETIWLILSLVSMLVSLLIIGLGLAFIKRYRDVLLGERTEFEIDTIKDWENARLTSIVISSVGAITYSVALLWNTFTSLSISYFSIIEIVIDAVLVVPYIAIIIYLKLQNMKNTNKSFYISRIFKSIDNGLLLDTFAWIIVVKTVLLQGAGLSMNVVNNSERALITLISFASIVLMYGFTMIISVNIPNLRNTAVSAPTIGFSFVLGLFAILFGGYLVGAGRLSQISDLVFLFMSLVLLVGLSISLVIKISIIAKIFKVNWNKVESLDKSYLIEMQEKEEFNFIGEKTKEVDVEQINQMKEEVKNNGNKTSVEDLRNILREESKGV